MTGPVDASEEGAATRTLAQLHEQTMRVRIELARLQRDLGQVQRDFDSARAAQLLEANEHLVLAALRAETLAEMAVNDLDALARVSQRDALTDTPNRTLMLDRLESAIALARRRGTRAAVLFLDLDDFKQINDTLGHAVGDAVLQLVARRAEAVVRDSDTVSRHGGDEFLVLLTEVSKGADAALIAAKLLAAVAAPSRIGEHELRLSASLGIAVYPEDGDATDTLIGRADAAMYRAKKDGPGCFRFHDEAIFGAGE